jgi:hypothetical protein
MWLPELALFGIYGTIFQGKANAVSADVEA